MSLYDRAHFAIIRVVHETLYGLFVDPFPHLRAAGLGPGHRVLEVGCGPGFFTIPAAELVGPAGRVDAIDINPVAVRHVKQKAEAKHLTNVEVTLADASKTDFPDSSFDVVFLFGVAHALDMKATLSEMHRVLKVGGSLSVEVHGSSEAGTLESVTRDGLFRLEERTARVCRFEKGS